MSIYPQEIRNVARSFYLKKWTPKEIAAELNLTSARIVYYWAEKYGWADLLTEESVEDCINRRVNLLVMRDNKSSLELDELDRLIGHHVKLITQRNKHAEKLAQASASGLGMTGSGESIGFMGAGEDTPRRKGGRKKKNDVSALTPEVFEVFAGENLFQYQRTLRDNKSRSIRNLLKSRQVGATWYFAWEALEDACATGDNQIFVSASKRQAEIFRRYIVKFAQQLAGVELTGNPITLSNGANLIFLATNASTAQGESGHYYFDEYFWVPKFQKFKDVSSAIATHDKWRRTYFSTPSAKTHDAYPFWTGDEWKGRNKKRQAEKFPDFDELRDGGCLCPDGQWRYILTLEDACAGGLDKFVTVSRIRDEISEDAYALLYGCRFVDAADCVFRFDQLVRCEVDTGSWQDFDPDARRPFGEREVWGGFDPARSGDTSTFVVLAPPLHIGERFRVLETHHWQGLSFKYQAEQIRKISERFRMTYIGIDVTGIGRGVYERVQSFAPREVRDIHYSVETKTRLVMKMIDIVDCDRIEWSEEKRDIAGSFLAIRKTVTGSGNAITFVAQRTAETGHADVFFAISHAAINEPLNYDTRRKSTYAFAS